jgi:hypothetical protein
MLLNGEEFRYVKMENFERKLRKYTRDWHLSETPESSLHFWACGDGV